MPSFREVYDLLIRKGDALIVSSRGTEYSVEARDNKIIAHLTKKVGRITVHEDCWMKPLTCQRTRAGALYRGTPSLLDWYEANK